MKLPEFLELPLLPLPANLRASRVRTDRRQWLQLAATLRESGARLLALWGADDRDSDGCFRIYAAYLLTEGVLLVEHAMETTEATADPVYPSLAAIFPVAQRMQRAVYDLLGIAAE